MDPIQDLQSQNLSIDDANADVFFNVAESFDSENASATPSLSLPSATGTTPILSHTTSSSLKEIPQVHY